MISGSGRSPGNEWVVTPVSLSGEFHGQRSLAGYRLWGKELDTTERLTLIIKEKTKLQVIEKKQLK